MKSSYVFLLSILFTQIVIAQTKSPMPVADMQACFPETVQNGFIGVGEKEGTSLGNDSLTFTTVIYQYQQNSTHLEVSIFDFNATSDMHTQSFAMYDENLHVEENGKFMDAVKIDESIGWIVWRPQQKTADLVMSLNERYIIMISGTEVYSKEQLIKLFEDLNLDELE